jgi:tetratricopeptide (TPR) repeat protein
LNNRGIAYASEKQYDRAIEDYSQAIRLAPGYWEAFNNSGIAYESEKEYDRAIEEYTQVIRLEPSNAHAFSSRCWARILAGQSQDRRFGL